MRILMTESDPRAGAEVEALLVDAGHEVLSCTGPGQAFPCRGVAGDACPLDEGVAVAVSAPGSIPPEPKAGDVGVICVLRRHLPLVVVAPDGHADLLVEVERAAAAPLADHTEALRVEVRKELGPEADASVVRAGTGLLVTIDVPAGTDPQTVEAVAVKAKGTIRRIDPWATIIDVCAQER